MQRSFVKVSYTHMLKSFIKAQANCFCIRYTGPSISPCSVCPWEGNTCFEMHSPRGGRAGDTPGAGPEQLTRAALPPALATAGAQALWRVGEAASLLLHHSLCTRHSSGWIFCCIGFPHIYPDITWAGALPASTQQELANKKKKVTFRK